jgi:hypothetical protein
MPTHHPNRPLLAGVGLLALASSSLVIVEHAPPSPLPPAVEEVDPWVLGGLALLSGGLWFLVGYALGGGLRSLAAPPSGPSSLPPPLDLGALSTEQLFRELERMNLEALLEGARWSQHVPPHNPTRHDLSERFNEVNNSFRS